jgi:integrase
LRVFHSGPVPPYRHKLSPKGTELAYVTLYDPVTKQRQDLSLGLYGSEESRLAYHSVLAAWEKRCRRVLRVPKPRGDAPWPQTGGVVVAQIAAAYQAHAKDIYGPKELSDVDQLCRMLIAAFGPMPAETFSPVDLLALREAMIRGNPTARPKPRKPWCRTHVNRAVLKIRKIFRWAVAHQLITPSVLHGLEAVEGLRRGRSTAVDRPPVRPVSDGDVAAARAKMAIAIRAMVDLQSMTGMRPGEVVIMRTIDLDTSGPVWTYTPARHKTEHRGKSRTIWLGPQAQEVLRPWLRTAVEEPLFQPTEAVAGQLAARHARRKTRRGQGNEPGDVHTPAPRRPPGNAYTVDSYRRAIGRACDAAGIDRWHPHQLRHRFATRVRKQFGLEMAAIMLDHSSAKITDAVYAERDQAKAMEVARSF